MDVATPTISAVHASHDLSSEISDLKAERARLKQLLIAVILVARLIAPPHLPYPNLPMSCVGTTRSLGKPSKSANIPVPSIRETSRPVVSGDRRHWP